MTPDEIVKRLRRNNAELLACGNDYSDTLLDAAELIERQAKALGEAEKALLKFATEAETYEPDEGDNDYPIWGEQTITIGHLRRARAALSKIRSARGDEKSE